MLQKLEQNNTHIKMQFPYNYNAVVQFYSLSVPFSYTYLTLLCGIVHCTCQNKPTIY